MGDSTGSYGKFPVWYKFRGIIGKVMVKALIRIASDANLRLPIALVAGDFNPLWRGIFPVPTGQVPPDSWEFFPNFKPQSTGY